MVSQYFHATLRKRLLVGISISDFIRTKKYGIPYLNRRFKVFSSQWTRADRLVICYEDLFEQETWEKMIKYLDLPFNKVVIKKTMEATKLETIKKNLHKLQNHKNAAGFLANENGKLKVNPINPNSHKFRRGKVGGYVDYLSKEDIKYIMDNFSFGEYLNSYRERYLSMTFKSNKI
jgi:hypothetical protein